MVGHLCWDQGADDMVRCLLLNLADLLREGGIVLVVEEHCLYISLEVFWVFEICAEQLASQGDLCLA